MKRSNNLDFRFLDCGDVRNQGRYVLYAAPDFFVDRNVKAIEKIEILSAK